MLYYTRPVCACHYAFLFWGVYKAYRESKEDSYEKGHNPDDWTWHCCATCAVSRCIGGKQHFVTCIHLIVLAFYINIGRIWTKGPAAGQDCCVLGCMRRKWLKIQKNAIELDLGSRSFDNVDFDGRVSEEQGQISECGMSHWICRSNNKQICTLKWMKKWPRTWQVTLSAYAKDKNVPFRLLVFLFFIEKKFIFCFTFIIKLLDSWQCEPTMINKATTTLWRVVALLLACVICNLPGY